MGWSRQSRIVLLRRKLDRPLVILERTPPEQSRLSFAEVGPDREVWVRVPVDRDHGFRWKMITQSGGT